MWLRQYLEIGTEVSKVRNEAMIESTKPGVYLKIWITSKNVVNTDRKINIKNKNANIKKF